MSTWHPMDLVRLTAGMLDLTAAPTVAAVELGSPPDGLDLAIYRVLGARQAVQAWVTAETGWATLGAVVDLLHFTSMVPVALLSHRWRRAALVQMTIAGSLCIAGFRRG